MAHLPLCIMQNNVKITYTFFRNNNNNNLFLYSAFHNETVNL